MSNKTFATVLNCMDGRCQDAVSALAREMFGVDVVDTITEPGIDRLLAGGEYTPAGKRRAGFAEELKAWNKDKAAISIGHGSTQILIVGHMGCAGNPVGYDKHLEDLCKAKEVVASWGFNEIRIAAFDENGELKEI